jgi:putative FmdB family regulatory protein
MPVYVYRCPECGKEIEKICSVAERKDFITCETCNKEAKQIIKPAAVIWRAPGVHTPSNLR